VGDVAAEILPLALVVAASPFPILPAIFSLCAPRARLTGLGFLAGWAGGIGVATAVFVALATVIEQREETPTWTFWARLVIGAFLIVSGIRVWLNRDARAGSPAWMQSLDGIGPAGALRLGFLLSAVNPKIILLAAAGGLAIGSAALGLVNAALLAAGFTAVAASSVAIPIFLYLCFGERVDAPLRAVRGWLEENNAVVMSVVIVAIGVMLVIKGLKGLL
jgi:threonine/homoserine/homoserine lactone efflux protein